MNLDFNINEMISNIKGHACAKSFTRLKDAHPVKCPLCQASFNAQYAKTVCENCNICVIGKECLGLHLVDDF